MAFPTAGAAVTTSFSTSVTSMPVNLPASIVSGNLLLATVSVRNSGTWTVPTGWTQLFTPVASGGVGDLTVFYKVASGSEGSTATWTASTGTTGAWQTRMISGWHGSAAPEALTANSGGIAGTAANPPSLTPSWGAADTLWIEVAGGAAESIASNTQSTNYTGATWTNVSAGGASAYIGTATRQLNASSEDPGAYGTTSRWWVAATVAVRPSGATTVTLPNGTITATATVTASPVVTARNPTGTASVIATVLANPIVKAILGSSTISAIAAVTATPKVTAILPSQTAAGHAAVVAAPVVKAILPSGTLAAHATVTNTIPVTVYLTSQTLVGAAVVTATPKVSAILPVGSISAHVVVSAAPITKAILPAGSINGLASVSASFPVVLANLTLAAHASVAALPVVIAYEPVVTVTGASTMLASPLATAVLPTGTIQAKTAMFYILPSTNPHLILLTNGQLALFVFDGSLPVYQIL